MKEEERMTEKMTAYKLKTPRVIEKNVIGTYKKIEVGVVDTYKKIENRFVETFLEEVSDTEKGSKTEKS